MVDITKRPDPKRRSDPELRANAAIAGRMQICMELGLEVAEDPVLARGLEAEVARWNRVAVFSELQLRPREDVAPALQDWQIEKPADQYAAVHLIVAHIQRLRPLALDPKMQRGLDKELDTWQKAADRFCPSGSRLKAVS